jgi:hypothetical protein
MEVSPKQANQSKTHFGVQNKNLKRKIRSISRQLEGSQNQLETLRQEKLQANEQVQQLQSENQILRAQAIEAQHDSPSTNETLESFCHERGVVNHTFGARMIALCVNLAKRLPFRAVPDSLALIFQALGLSMKIPSHDSIEHWCKRIGLNQIKKRREHHADMLWIVDHSNQIGQEKLLVILGIRASELPPLGQTLSLDQLEVLAIVPAKDWKRDDVRNAYQLVAQRCGTPKFLVCDGAVELRETVDVLENAGKKVIVLRDFKHFAANCFEKLIGKMDRFQEFTKQMGLTRCRVQQTELAHLTPLSLKTKARFMNVAPIVRWSELVLFALDYPQSDAVAGIEQERLTEKLGWVSGFRNEIMAWSQCCQLVGRSLAWINKQGLSCNSGSALESHLQNKLQPAAESLAAELQKLLVEFVSQHASQLKAGERAWLSSEPIESLFGLYKRREGQHSRSGFTGMVATIPTLLKTWSPQEVRASLQQTKNKDVRDWTKNTIGQTVAGRRANAYKEMKKMKKNQEKIVQAA